MNFLAHIYLSGEDEQVILGNFIADGIKGASYKKYPEGIQKGILLHREIDTFTDMHPTVRKSTKRLHKRYSHYSSVIVDILYDHFLAKNWTQYSDVPLEVFVEDFYTMLRQNRDKVPSRIQKMMPYMIADNWLLSYASVSGIAKILSQMNMRTRNRSKMNTAVEELEAHYEDFEREFTDFFPKLVTFSQLKYRDICDTFST